MGEDGVQETDYMHFKREITMIIQSLYSLSTGMFIFYVPSHFMINNLHDREEIISTPAIPLNQ